MFETIVTILTVVALACVLLAGYALHTVQAQAKDTAYRLGEMLRHTHETCMTTCESYRIARLDELTNRPTPQPNRNPRGLRVPDREVTEWNHVSAAPES